MLKSRLRLLALGGPLTGVSWALIWTQDTFWNHLFFTGMWTGAALVMYAAGSRGYPGWRRHLVLLAVSVPLWWWFELVNERVGNWEYIYSQDYNALEYQLLASAAFSTVVPALHAAWSLTQGAVSRTARVVPRMSRRSAATEAMVGASMIAATFVVPDQSFPLVWVGPFLLLDGLLGYRGDSSLVNEMINGEYRLAVTLGVAGLICGFLWEFWNFWATPKWVYHVPYFGFLHLFEMPLLGYGGYIPFAWSVHQLTSLSAFRLVDGHVATVARRAA